MKTYARVETGIVQEIIAPAIDSDGNEIPIAERFTADLVAQMVDVTNINPQPVCWWTYDGTDFAAPTPQMPTAVEIIAANTAIQSQLLSAASVAISPLQMAVSLGEATDAETAAAKAWVAYSRALKAIDLTQASPVWPTEPSV